MKKSIQLVLWIILLQAISYVMGMLTESNLVPWYASLHQSMLTPPGFVFGIVWGLLYVLLAIVGWQLYHIEPYMSDSSYRPLKLLFMVQLVFNWLWTPLFFYLHAIQAALFCLAAMVLFTTVFLMIAWQKARRLFWCMLPYWLWVCFASYLNFIIWMLNKP